MNTKIFKYFIFLVCSMLLINTSCNQSASYKSIAEKYNSVEFLCVSLLEVDGIHYLFDDKYTGSCINYDTTFSYKVSLESYVEGRKKGKSIGYYPSGEIEYIGNIENGEINGQYEKFYKNGQVAIKGQFSDGLYVGIFKYFDENGKLIERKKYNKYGILLKSKTY